MDKREKKYFGAKIALMGGFIFLLSAFSSIYVAFFIKPETATRFITALARLLH